MTKCDKNFVSERDFNLRGLFGKGKCYHEHNLKKSIFSLNYITRKGT